MRLKINFLALALATFTAPAWAQSLVMGPDGIWRVVPNNSAMNQPIVQSNSVVQSSPIVQSNPVVHTGRVYDQFGNLISGPAMNSTIGGTPIINGQPLVNGQLNGPIVSGPLVTGQPIIQQQSGPALVTGNQVTGVNSQTGGLNTFNQQIDHSAFRDNREASKNNGTYRYIRRPVYDTAGNVVGYQEGYVWNNSVTGEEHGDVNNFTVNQQGGVHQQMNTRGGRTGVHTQRQTYGNQNPGRSGGR